VISTFPSCYDINFPLKREKLISQQEGKDDITTRRESSYHNKRGKLISQQEGKVDITTRGES
jgi:hypothetical protein